MSGAAALVAFLVFGVILVRWWFASVSTPHQRLQSDSPIPIAQFPTGEIHTITGEVQPDVEGLTAPLTGRGCALYRVIVEERVDGGSGLRWATVFEDLESRSFIVTDPSGRARVDPTYAKLLLGHESRFESGTFKDAAPRLREYLAHHGEQSETFVFNRNLRYRETVLELGEVATVMGPGQVVDDPRSPGSKILEIRWQATDAPIISNR